MTRPPGDDSFELEYAAKRAKRRKALWIIGGVFAVILGLIGYTFVADEAPPDTSDLVVQRLNPPEDQNAHALLTKIVSTLPPEPADGSPISEYLDLFAGGKVAWDQPLVTAELARYSPEIFIAVESALQAPASEAPEIKTFADPIPAVGPMRRLGKILTYRAQAAYHVGDHAEALKANLQALRLGQRLSAAKGGFIQVLTGTAIKNMARSSIQSHVDTDTVSKDALREYLSKIVIYENTIRDFQTAFKVEHRPFAQMVNDTKSIRTAFNFSRNPSLGALAGFPGIYKPQQTIRYHADVIRAYEASLNSPPIKATKSELNVLLDEIVNAPWPGRALNLSGRSILAIVTPTLGDLSITCHRSEANARLTLLYVALRLYSIEHENTLPDTLDALVPDYLPAIPLDPFDGKPLRYSRALTTIWSTDAERTTITTADDELPKGTPAYRLKFARPPVELPSYELYQTQSATSEASP